MIACKPFLKWVGGKTRLLPKLAPLFPSDWAELRHCEPFVGGGGVFFGLAPQRACLSDKNADLIDAYRYVKHNPAVMAKVLIDVFAPKHSAAFYALARKHFNDDCRGVSGSLLQRTAAFIYLNKAGFNGLCRYNKSGRFNVPFGKAPSVSFDKENFVACGELLQRATLSHAPFDSQQFGAGDFVYCDPPYDDTFNGYQPGGFDQIRLAEYAGNWANRGAKVCLSNSDTPNIRRLYADWDITELSAPRSVSRNGAGRKPVTELVIRSY